MLKTTSIVANGDISKDYVRWELNFEGTFLDFNDWLDNIELHIHPHYSFKFEYIAETKKGTINSVFKRTKVLELIKEFEIL